MKLSSLTIGHRVALGFSLLLFLGAALGGFAELQMGSSATGALFLADAVAPQASVTSTLSVHSANAQKAARAYGLSGDERQLALARTSLGEVEKALVVARKLSEDQPKLTALREGLAETERGLKTYVSDFDKTVVNLTELEAIRTRLNVGAAAFVAEITAYIRIRTKSWPRRSRPGARRSSWSDVART